MLEREPCEEWIEKVSAYADGELAEADEAEVGAHLDSCDACREWLEQVRADRSAMAAALSGQKRRRSFARAVMQEVAKEPARGNAKAPRPWYRLTLVDLGACVVILGILGVVLTPVFMKAREKARQTQTLSQVKQLGLATVMYTSDWDERWPQWEYLGTGPGAGRNYAFVDGHAKWIGEPDAFVFDGDSIRTNVRNRGLLAEKPGASSTLPTDAYNVAQASGRAESVGATAPELEEREHTLGAPTRNYGLADKLHIAYEAQQDLEVENAHAAMVQAEQEIKDRDGFLLNSDLVTADGRTEATIVFRVPSEVLLDTMNALAKLGTVVSRHVVGKDLTDKYVAAERAVESEAQKQERLRTIDRRAYRSSEKMSVAEQIAESHVEAEKQRGIVRDALARTVLATGIVRFLEPDAVRAGTLLASAERAWRSAGAAGRVVATGGLWIVAYAPFWGTAAAAFFIARHLRRRRQRDGNPRPPVDAP